MPRRLAVLLTIAGAAWALAIVLAPVAAGDAVPALPAALLYSAAATICHQRPERTFEFGGAPWLVCARCAGLYASAALGALAAWRGGASAPRRVRLLLAAAALPTALTLLLEWAGAFQPGNLGRALAAVPLGAAAAWVSVRALRAESAERECAMI